jgi:DNA-directed RNA polymerase specialized sigma24 family protein
MSTTGHNRFDGTDWRDVCRRLTAYATLLFRGDNVMQGTGTSPVDLVQNVIEQVMRGKIEYDGKRPLLPLLKKALFRDFLDLKKSAPRRTTTILEPHEGPEGELVGGLDSLDHHSHAEPDVLFRQAVYEAIGDDGDLKDYVSAFFDFGLSKPRDIAELLGTTTTDVENRRKRLRTALAPVRSRLEA